ncbi:AAA family ATPase [Klebsiella variicola subsp. variicola]|nr:AAA family ATPase [Klebsiella variicola subsp. variicola]
MKILSLRLKNLNSLKGEWKIDFTAEPFVSNGLFAITGATGAGKIHPARCHLPGALSRDAAPE